MAAERVEGKDWSRHLEAQMRPSEFVSARKQASWIGCQRMLLLGNSGEGNGTD